MALVLLELNIESQKKLEILEPEKQYIYRNDMCQHLNQQKTCVPTLTINLQNKRGDMPCGKKRKRRKINTHKRKKRLRANRHKKK